MKVSALAMRGSNNLSTYYDILIQVDQGQVDVDQGLAPFPSDNLDFLQGEGEASMAGEADSEGKGKEVISRSVRAR